jgi:hypothetical protein
MHSSTKPLNFSTLIFLGVKSSTTAYVAIIVFCQNLLVNVCARESPFSFLLVETVTHTRISKTAFSPSERAVRIPYKKKNKVLYIFLEKV